MKISIISEGPASYGLDKYPHAHMMNTPEAKWMKLVDSFSILEECEWVGEISIDQFLNNFSKTVSEVRACGGQISEQYIALRLLRATKLDKLHCLGHLNIIELDYREVKQLLCKIYQHQTQTHKDPENPHSPNEQRGWSGKGSNTDSRTRGKDPAATKNAPLLNKIVKPSQINISSKIKEKPKVKTSNQKDTTSAVNSLRQQNPANQHGVVSKCVICRSIYHWSIDCPDLVTHNVDISYQDLLDIQTRTAGDNTVLITADVSKSLVGLSWITQYLETLPPSLVSQVVDFPASNSFRIKNFGEISSFQNFIIPLMGNKDGHKSISVDVVDVDFPLLLSRNSLRKAQTVLDPVAATAEMCGKTIQCTKTEQGYYFFPLFFIDVTPSLLLLTEYCDNTNYEQSCDGDWDERWYPEDSYEDSPQSHAQLLNSKPGNIECLHETSHSYVSKDKTYYNYGNPVISNSWHYPYPVRL